MAIGEPAGYTEGMTHRVGIKGQVVIPKAIRDEIGIKPDFGQPRDDPKTAPPMISRMRG